MLDIKRSRLDRPRRVLLVHPSLPPTFWGFQYALHLAGRRATLPPLGLITVAALLPDDWDLRLVDLNVEDLHDRDVLWADAVLAGGMHVQAPSLLELIGRVQDLGRPVIVGGPGPSTQPEAYAAADVVLCGEMEGREQELVDAVCGDLGPGVHRSPDPHPPLASSPVPRFDLLDLEAYAELSVQTSRGCPYLCEFCDVIEIFGRAPRTKTPDAVLAEFNAIRALGYRGPIFMADDNFIGHKPAAAALIPRLASWQRARGYPFELHSQASVVLADEPELMEGLVEAGFTAMFVGIETPSVKALEEAGKQQNLRMDPQEAVRRISRAGIEVFGGFIVGFDSDDLSVIDEQRRFLDEGPIAMAMVGLLTALPGTALWRRLEAEGRLRPGLASDHFGRPNFEPTLDEADLLRGYRDLLASLYEPAAYYARSEAFLDLARPGPAGRPVTAQDLRTAARTLWGVGVRSPRRRHFWRLLARSAAKGPSFVPWAIVRGLLGEHLIEYTRRDVLPRIDEALCEVLGRSRSRRLLRTGA